MHSLERISNLNSLKGCENKAQGKRSAALGVRSKDILCPVGAPQDLSAFLALLQSADNHKSNPKASLCSALGFALPALQAGKIEIPKIEMRPLFHIL